MHCVGESDCSGKVDSCTRGSTSRISSLVREHMQVACYPGTTDRSKGSSGISGTHSDDQSKSPEFHGRGGLSIHFPPGGVAKLPISVLTSVLFNSIRPRKRR